MKVWIDMSNSPHPLLFAPVARRLQDAGHEVLVTARDNAQTVALTLERWPDATVFGAESPPSRLAKAGVLARRVAELRRWARGRRPDVALSHNSYAQIVAAASCRMPIVTAMDFEHQPANHVAFHLADTILLPEALPSSLVRRQGARACKVRHYSGLKEELYLADFVPDAAVEQRAGITRVPGTILVVARTPPSRASYHRFGNPLFEAALRVVCGDPRVVCIVLARHAEQRAAIAELALENCIVPDEVLDSRSLMYRADVVLGAGGTMTREAALLEVPVFSLFAGRAAAVDDWLIRRGLLQRLERAEDLRSLTRRPREPPDLAELARRGAVIQREFVAATLAAGARR
jgi:predicted glycosyltransferase